MIDANGQEIFEGSYIRSIPDDTRPVLAPLHVVLSIGETTLTAQQEGGAYCLLTQDVITSGYWYIQDAPSPEPAPETVYEQAAKILLGEE